MPVFVYDGESPRLYPYPPIARKLTPGDEIELEEEQVPSDGRFVRKESSASPRAKSDAKPKE